LLRRVERKTSDTTPPVLVAINLSDNVINLNEGESSFGVAIQATDDLSGIAAEPKSGLFIRFVSPSGLVNPLGQFTDASHFLGPEGDNVYDLNITLNQFAEAGVWRASWVLLRDDAGNQTSL